MTTTPGPAGLPREVPHRRLARLTVTAVGLVVLALVVVVVALLIPGDRSRWPGYLPEPADVTHLSLPAVLAAAILVVAVFVAFGAAHLAASVRVLARDRRIPDPLPPPVRRLRRAVLGRTGAGALAAGEEVVYPRPVPLDVAQPASLTVLIPAYNEGAVIGQTLQSLAAQSRRPDRIVVVADNCTDDTETVARSLGADVRPTVGNTQKKAGALNQALTDLLPATGRGDIVMIMDADTVLAPHFLETALGRMERDPELAAVGGVFYGEQGFGLLGQLQRNEFARYGRYIGRRRGRVFVLTGTASLFRASALQAVAGSRGTLVPGDPDQVYDTLALTEDNELTLAVKTLGGPMVSPKECSNVTEVMPTWRQLWGQRMRWQRGALENLGAYGLTRTTARYWGQQIGIGYGTIALNAYLFLMLVTVLAADEVRFLWFWVLIGMIFVVERIVTVWPLGWRARLLAAPLVIEIGYDLVLQAVFVKSLWDIAWGRKSGWNSQVRTEGRS